MKYTSFYINFDCTTFSYKNRLIGLVGRVFANGQGDQGSIPGRVIPETGTWYFFA